MLSKLISWCTQNQLSLNFVEDYVYEINSKKFLLLLHKNDLIIDKGCNLVLSTYEKSKVESVDYLVYLWGEKFCYTPTNKVHDPEMTLLRYIGQINENLLFQTPSLPFLGIHGKYELLNGSKDYEDWVQKAKFLRVESLGICEKNTLAGTLLFQQECKKSDIHSILGETISIKSKDEVFLGKLFVKNEEGWRNLLLINTEINVVNYPSRFIDESRLFELSAGLVFIFHPGYFPFSEKREKEYSAVFSELYYQLDSTIYTNDSTDKDFLLETQKYLKSRLQPILISDAYYLEEGDFEIKSILNSLSGERDLLAVSQHFKTDQENISLLLDLFEDDGSFYDILSVAIENLQKVSESCDYSIPIGIFKLPKYKQSEAEEVIGYTNEQLFFEAVRDGFQLKVIEQGLDPEPYFNRLDLELDVIQRGGFIDYFLILWDIIRYCDREKILTGLGRGSAAGCLVAYLLNITKLDPLPYGLLFERFLNEGRLGKSLPDIDCDFEAMKKSQVKRYMEQKYGQTRVCSIGTYTTFQIKAAIKDLSRVQGIEIGTVELISKLIGGETSDGRFFREPWEYIFQAACKNPIIKSFVLDHSDLIENIQLCLGQPKASSVHPCATLILPENESIYTSIPVRQGEIDGEKLLVSEWEGELIEKAGYLKEDILGISQLDKFGMIMDLVKKNYKQDIDIYSLPLDEEEVFKMFRKGFNGDVFHLGSKSLTKYCVELAPEKIEDLIAALAVYRPGPIESNTHNEFILLRHGERQPEYYPGTEEITKETYSLIIYQEQIMQICQRVGGFSLVEADDIRKAMGKLNQKLLDSYEERWFQGATANGYDIETVTALWKKMVAFGGYAFNKSHSAAYAITGYICQYLKWMYPLPYWITALEFANDSNVLRFISEINATGDIEVSPPDINKSQLKFSADFSKDKIIWSISSVKQCGEVATQAIFTERNKNGQFFSLQEFLERVDKSKVNKSVVENLILAGAFDDLESLKLPSERRVLIEEYRKFANTKVDKDKDWFTLSQDQPFFYEEWFWTLKQRQLSGLAFFDYRGLVESRPHWSLKKYTEASSIINLQNADLVRRQIVTGGIIMDVESKESRKGPWMKLQIEHNYEIFWLYVWSDIYDKHKDLLLKSKGSLLIFNGRVVWDDFRNENIVQAEEDFQVEVL